MGLFGPSTPFDADVEKATSETNTDENWALIMEVCDKVSNNGNAKECLKAIMRRMSHNDPHVVLQAITLLDACVSNCGKTFHLQIASREFQTEFIRLLGKVQPKVQDKMCQVLKGWAEGNFKTDPELNLIPTLYAKLRQDNYDFFNFNDKPHKSEVKFAAAKDPNVVSSQQEEDDLAKAIELSLKEVKNSPKQASSSISAVGSSNYPSLYPSMSSAASAASSGAVEPRKVRALYDFEAAEENELTFVAGEIIHVTDDSDPNWWKGYNQKSEGLFPSNFVTADLSIDPERLEINQQHKIKKSTQFEEDSKELQQKTEAAAAAATTQRIDIDEQKIDRLLDLLNEANPEDPSQDTEEMLRLEQEVHQMGPLIDAELERVDRKHAQLSQLSSDLVDAINLYHSLMRDDRNALSSPYNIAGAMHGLQMPGTGFSGHPNMLYASNPAFTGALGPHSLPAGMSSLPYSPPTGSYPTHPMTGIPVQYQNGHVGTQQAPSQPPSLHGLPSQMNHQMMQQQRLQNPQQQPGIYGPPQHMIASNLNSGTDSQQPLPNQHSFNHMMPPQQQNFMQHQTSTTNTTVASAMPSNHMGTPTPILQVPTQQHQSNQFISPQNQHVQQPQYINAPSNQPSTNPHIYNPSVGDPQQSIPFMTVPQNVTVNMPSSSGPLDQLSQLQQQMANMAVAGQQPYQTNVQQNIPIYQQQRNPKFNDSKSVILSKEKNALVTELSSSVEMTGLFSKISRSNDFSSYTDANSPTNRICSSESSAMMCKSHLQYDQHSSEEELEVINGPSSVAAAEAAACNVLTVRGTSSLISERGSSSLDPDELQGEVATVKRSSSTLVENRKRSLAHSSDDDLRNFLEPILTPVNFRTSPPLEAFKPNRSHMYRSTTPLILQEARCGIENIKLCDNSVNDENGGEGTGNNGDTCCAMGTEDENTENNEGTASSIIKMKMSNSTSSHHIYQPQAKHNFHFNSSRSSPASTTGLDVEVRSVSPPAKLFHCAISPRRRPMRTQHNSQRLQRPHRPCLDFDKMQQVSL